MAEPDKKIKKELPLIDLDKIIGNSKSKLLKSMPRFVISYLKKLIHQDEVNQQIIDHQDKFGLDFIFANLKYLNVSVRISGIQRIPQDRRYIFACNHPLGGVDFYAALIAARKKFRDVKVIANDILMNMENLKGLFLPVNVFGRSPQSYYDMIKEALASEVQVMTFPAGEVSRRRKGVIKDGPWHRSFIRNAIEYKRDVVPVYIHAKNSNRFYILGRLREMLGIKLNLELFLLPDELFRQKNKTIRVVIGNPVPYTTFDNSKEPLDWAQEMKEKVYKLQKELSMLNQANFNS